MHYDDMTYQLSQESNPGVDATQVVMLLSVEDQLVFLIQRGQGHKNMLFELQLTHFRLASLFS